MQKLKIAGLVLGASLMAGCATLEGGESLQCSLARILGQSAEGCSNKTGQVVQTSERWTLVQKAFDGEIDGARQAQRTAVEHMGRLPASQRATAGEVTLLDVILTDGSTQTKNKVRTLDTVTVNLPLAAKGKPEHLAAFNSILDFANVVADNRGSAVVIVYQNPADVRAGRANPTGTVLKTKEGMPVTVRKESGAHIPSGVERYTIKAGELRGKL